MEALKRIGKKGEQKQFKQVNVSLETHEKVKELAERENTTQVELIRYLIDVAHAGDVDFGNGGEK